MEWEEHYIADNSTVDDSGLWRKKKMADTHAKEANPAVNNGGLCKKKKIADTGVTAEADQDWREPREGQTSMPRKW
jgi:hypothetical protein